MVREREGWAREARRDIRYKKIQGFLIITIFINPPRTFLPISKYPGCLSTKLETRTAKTQRMFPGRTVVNMVVNN